MTGRDLEEFELALRLDKTQCRWQHRGDAEARAREQARKEYGKTAPWCRPFRKLVERNHGRRRRVHPAGRYWRQASC